MKRILALGLALLSCVSLIAAPLSAATVVAGAGAENSLFVQTVDATANYTNATTTASDVTGLSVSVPARPWVALGAQYYRACVYADAGKGTATNGTLTVNVNGADVAASARQIQSAAGRGIINVCFTGARPTASAFTVKVRGVSGDTNTFTVYNAQMKVELFYILS